MTKSDFVYIYNEKQAKFYISEFGIMPDFCGVHEKTNKKYYGFLKKLTFEAYQQWNRLNK